MPRAKMILAAFFYNPQGDHRMSWRHPGAPGHEIFGLDYYRRLVLEAERARIDAVFVADHLGIWDTTPSGVAHYANPRLEPITLVAALAATTTAIGFVVTASTSYSEPYNIARMFASLDHVSQGRIGWNVVTSALDEEARNFGLDGNIEHARRYGRAAEFLDVTKALWDSWDDDAVLIDKGSGTFADPAKIHYLHHAGAHFRVKGPLNVPRPPQGHPLLVQAGSSEAGRELAARYADIQFAAVKSTEQGLAYRADMNERLARHGRTPDSFRLMAGILPVVASSRDEAAEKQAAMEALMLDQVGIDLLSNWAGVDLSSFPLDGPIPELPDLETYDGWRTWLKIVQDEANAGLSIRQLARRIANTGSMPLVAGTPVQIADRMEEWFAAGAVDGYNLMFPLLPDDWSDFMQRVVPELQRRGLHQHEYQSGTLRSRLGLARPANVFARA